jgi:hypothetical protein
MASDSKHKLALRRVIAYAGVRCARKKKWASNVVLEEMFRFSQAGPYKVTRLPPLGYASIAEMLLSHGTAH